MPRELSGATCGVARSCAGLFEHALNTAKREPPNAPKSAARVSLWRLASQTSFMSAIPIRVRKSRLG